MIELYFKTPLQFLQLQKSIKNIIEYIPSKDNQYNNLESINNMSLSYVVVKDNKYKIIQIK